MTIFRPVFLVAVGASLLALSLAGCTAEQRYDSAQGWRNEQCSRNLDKAAYDRCMTQANTPYDSYKRQTEPDQKQ